MALKMSCDICGSTVLGVAGSLRKIDGKYMCRECILNPKQEMRYYCNACHNHSANAKMKGNGWVELLLYLLYIAPGLIYSVWRRSGTRNICPVCTKDALVPAASAKSVPVAKGRDEVDCPHCAEPILARAIVCKHCGRTARQSGARGDTVPAPLR